MRKQKRPFIAVVRILIFLALLPIALIPQTPVYAATIIVDTTDDELNADTDCSLREAIEAANTNAAVSGCDPGSAVVVDVIQVPAGVYTLDLTGTGDDANARGDLDILQSVTINGAGSGTTIIENGYGLAGTLGDGDRHIQIDPGGIVTGVNVVITGITFRNGDLGTPATGFIGASSIFKEGGGNLTIEDSVFTNNQMSCSTVNDCGHEFNSAVLMANFDGGDVTIRRSTFSNNQSDCSTQECDAGSPVLTFDGQPGGTLLVVDSVFTGNAGDCNADECTVGELFHFYDNGSNGNVSITGTTFSNNTIDCNGVECNTEDLVDVDDAVASTLTNVTIQNNILQCEGTECDTDSVLVTDGTEKIEFENVQVLDNTTQCDGDECSAAETVDLGNYVITITHSAFSWNTITCSGDRCEGDEVVDFGTHNANTSPSEISFTTISDNTTTCTSANCRCDTPGLDLSGDGKIYISNSTFSGNSTRCNDDVFANLSAGGGIKVGSDDNIELKLINSTVSGNSTNGDGAGILFWNHATSSIINSTIVYNTADLDNDGDGEGGGIFYAPPSTGTLEIQNTLIANNVDPTSDPDCFGTLTSRGHNLIETVSANCSIVGTTTGNIAGEDPDINALGSNGGVTQTHALRDNSPAINAGDSALAVDANGALLVFDQRGTGFERTHNGVIDIGAYEYIPGKADDPLDEVEDLPGTGIPPGVLSANEGLPASMAYTALDEIRLVVPKLKLDLPVVGVPLMRNSWNVTWLGEQAGYLDGTAFPTWVGNTAITAHVWNADNTPGPFAKLKDLQHGDQFSLHAFGKVYTYEVRSNFQVLPNNLSIFNSSAYDTVTLLTCEFWDASTGEYLYRRAVQAVLISVE